MLIFLGRAASSLAFVSCDSGATVSGDAVAISLHFNSRIDRARSKLTLPRGLSAGPSCRGNHSL
ncbi:hypothetical protein ACNJYD_27990 [Bradyrhizobium sp. DASA03005]|uniref:hypothetical protein n=1 Tax=unclassified Bradyrhizobium TaxID=2631580 RepID=UPI003F7294BF